MGQFQLKSGVSFSDYKKKGANLSPPPPPFFFLKVIVVLVKDAKMTAL